jgi:hypothetical protein
MDGKHRQSEYAYLSEKKLNPNNYIKWNNNSGGFDGIAKINIFNYEPLQVELERPVWRLGLELVLEEEDEEEDEDEADDKLPSSRYSYTVSKEVTELKEKILESEISQAFSHFTFRRTQRNELVTGV